LQKLLNDDFDIFKEYYNINNYGKWENNHFVLIRKKTDLEIEKEFGHYLRSTSAEKKIGKTS